MEALARTHKPNRHCGGVFWCFVATVAWDRLLRALYHLSCALLSLVSNIFLINLWGNIPLPFFSLRGLLPGGLFTLDLHDRFIPQLFASWSVAARGFFHTLSIIYYYNWTSVSPFLLSFPRRRIVFFCQHIAYMSHSLVFSDLIRHSSFASEVSMCHLWLLTTTYLYSLSFPLSMYILGGR